MLAKNKKLTYALALLGIVAICAIYALSTVKRIAEAYIFAYPLVIMEETRLATLSGAKSNQITHLHEFPDHNFKRILVISNVRRRRLLNRQSD